MSTDAHELDEEIEAEFDLTDRIPDEYLDEVVEQDDDDLSHAEFDGDTGTLDADARRALVAILNHRFITSATHRKEWKALTSAYAAVKSRLNDMYLDLVFDEKYEVAYKFQVRNVDSTRPFPSLLRAMTWTRDQTAVLIYLRLAHRNQTAGGASRAVVSATDIQEFVAATRPTTATDQFMDTGRVTRAIDAVAATGLLESTRESGVFTVSPVLDRLMPLSKLQELLEYFSTTPKENSSD